MRIIQVVHQFLPKHIGGIELFLQNITTGLIDAGHNILVFSGSGDVVSNLKRKDERTDGLELVTIQNKINPSQTKHNFYRTFKNHCILKEFDNVIARFRPDLIHIHHTVYLSGDIVRLAKKKGIPVVVTIHDFWFLCHKLHLIDWRGNQCDGPCGGLKCAICFGMDRRGALTPFKPLLFAIPLIYRTYYQRRLLKLADVLLVPSRFVSEILGRHIHSTTKIVHLPYSIPHFTASPQQNHSSGQIKFGYMGSIKPHKGLHILIEAFNDLVNENVSLEIHGDPSPDKAYCADLIHRCTNKNVTFSGPYDNRNVNNVLDCFDILIVPSIWRETGPMVVLEALANGTPVIAANIGGLSELIKDGKNGFFFEQGNPNSLSSLIRSILAKPLSLHLLSPSQNKVHTMEHGLRKLMIIYQSL